MTIPCVSKRQEVYSFHDSYFKIMLKALLGLFNWLADYLHGGWVFETLGLGSRSVYACWDCTHIAVRCGNHFVISRSVQ